MKTTIIDIGAIEDLTKQLQDKLGVNLSSIQVDVERHGTNEPVAKWKAYHGSLGYSDEAENPDQAVAALLAKAPAKLYAQADSLRKQADTIEASAVRLESTLSISEGEEADRKAGFLKDTA